MKKNIKPYYVICWDWRKDSIEPYDIMPYLIEKYEKDKKSRSVYAKHPKTFEEVKKFILDESRYQFWSRCQYEVIVHGWPVHKKDHKMDVYEQIEMNIDIITKHFMNEVGIKENDKKVTKE